MFDWEIGMFMCDVKGVASSDKPTENCCQAQQFTTGLQGFIARFS